MGSLHHSDCAEFLDKLSDNSIEALITDPPAGIGFMGKEWDHHKGGRDEWVTWLTGIMKKCYRVMKPGAHGFVWAIPRTSHWTATALENAGFEIRDVVTHLFGSGFPKSLDISKAIDKAAGVSREVVGENPNHRTLKPVQTMCGAPHSGDGSLTTPTTPAAKQWQGWGAALKPASEHWILIRKPISEKTVAANVIKYGTGGINIDGCRIATGEMLGRMNHARTSDTSYAVQREDKFIDSSTGKGRFPANLVLSCDCPDQHGLETCAVAALDKQSGNLKGPGNKKPSQGNKFFGSDFKARAIPGVNSYPGQEGGASRFFYCAKTSKSERNAGLDRYELVSVINEAWDSADQKVTLQVDTAQSPPRVIDAFGLLNKTANDWNTVLFGKNTSDQSPKGCKFTTVTGLNSTIESKTLSWLLRYNTNASIQGASNAPDSGGNHADHAGQPSQSTISTNDVTVAVTSVSGAQLPVRWLIKSEGAVKSGHPTVKPQKLMSYLIKLITPPGGVVLDPFMGSGSTGCAAKREGFEFIGIEKEKEYFEIAAKRIEATSGNA